MARNVFISYNFNDRELAHNIWSLFQAGGGAAQGTPYFVENDVSHLGDAAIDREIRSVMNGCDTAVFVIGDNNHNSPWIRREAQLSVSMGLKKVAVRLPQTTGGLPPELWNIVEVEWDSYELAGEINNNT